MKKEDSLEPALPRWFRRVFHILVAVGIFALIFLFLRLGWREGCRIRQYSGTIGYRESAWTLSQGEEVLQQELSLPTFRKLEKGKQYSLTVNLTYDGREDPAPYALFYAHHLYAQAYLDGEQVFNYYPEVIEKRDRSKSPGNIFFAIPMPEDCLGKELEIRFYPPLDADIDYELPNIIFGDYATMFHYRFLMDLPHNVVGTLAAFLGLVSILFSTMALKGREYREGLFIGVFAMVYSFYSLTECPFNLHCLSNPYYTYLLNYAAFSLMPVFMMAFFGEKFRRHGCQLTCWLCAGGGFALMAVNFCLHFLGILDLRETLPLVHLEYFGGILLLTAFIATMEKSYRKRMLVLQLLPIFVGMILDGCVYYFHWAISESDAAFSSVGIVVFLVLELHHVWHSSIEIYMESIRSRYYQEMAFEDKLTGLPNRRAFEEEKRKILEQEKTFHSLIVASADVNDLKKTNDTLGHGEGDYLIRSAANVLQELTGENGSTFRTGGDEFMLLLYDVSEQELETRLQRASDRASAMNREGRAQLSLALGWQNARDLELESAIQLADRKMYEDKEKMKQAREPALK